MSDGIGNWLAGGAAGLIPAADLIAGAVPLILATSSQALRVSADHSAIAPQPLAITNHPPVSPGATWLSPATPLTSLLGPERVAERVGAVVISTNSPPIPAKIAQKIWHGGYIELGTLLPAKLGLPEPTLWDLVLGEKAKPKKDISSIQE